LRSVGACARRRSRRVDRDARGELLGLLGWRATRMRLSSGYWLRERRERCSSATECGYRLRAGRYYQRSDRSRAAPSSEHDRCDRPVRDALHVLSAPIHSRPRLRSLEGGHTVTQSQAPASEDRSSLSLARFSDYLRRSGWILEDQDALTSLWRRSAADGQEYSVVLQLTNMSSITRIVLAKRCEWYPSSINARCQSMIRVP
jgi:hypothetical protein